MMKLKSLSYLLVISTFWIGGLRFPAQGEQLKYSQVAEGLEIAQQDETEEKTPELQGIPKNVNKIARSITVRIDSADGNGSGVIFARDSNKYYVVTAKHVVEKQQNYQLVTEDEKVYQLKSSEIKKLDNTDLAIVQFTSEKNYLVAAFSDYNLGLNKEAWVFVYGWAKSKTQPTTNFSVGKVVGKETGFFLVKDDLSLDKTNGYELIYTNLSQPGMSGGAVLDTTGRVIGIHTSAEGERYRLSNKLQLGFSLGIPIGTFLKSEELKLLTQTKNLELATIKERADISPFSRPNLRVEDLNSVAIKLSSPGKDAKETEWVNYGNQLWRTARYEAAVKAFDRAIAQKTNFHQAYYGKGLALNNLGKIPQASKAFSQAIELDSNFYPAWYRQSLSLLNLKKYAQALAAIDKAISLQPENTALYALRGQALENLDRYDEALAAYSKAIAQDNNPLILTRRSSIYRILGKQNLALKDLNQAIQFDPRYTEGYINRGLTYFQLGDYQQTLINLNHAAKVNRLEPKVYLARGFVHQKLGDRIQAQADFIRAFNIYDRQQKIANENTAIKLQDEQGDRIKIDLKQIMQPEQGKANLNFGRGIAHLLLGEKKQAIATLTQARKQFQTQGDKFADNYAQKIISQTQQQIERENNVAQN